MRPYTYEHSEKCKDLRQSTVFQHSLSGTNFFLSLSCATLHGQTASSSSKYRMRHEILQCRCV